MRGERAASVLCAFGAAVALTASLTAQADAFDAAAAVAAKGDVEAARGAVAAFLHIGPGAQREARLAQAASMAFLAGDFDTCLRFSEEAESTRVATRESRVAGWRSLVAKGRAATLVRELRAAVDDLDPAAADEVLGAEEGRIVPLADGLMRDGQVDDGLWLFEAVATRLPDDAVRLSNFALALRHAGRLDDALRQYERALELAPRDSWTWNDYGLLLRVRGDRAGALTAFRHAYDLDARPGEGPGITNLVLESVLRGGEDPIPRAKAALATRPDAALLRRAVIDQVLRARPSASPQQLPDNRAGGR